MNRSSQSVPFCCYPTCKQTGANRALRWTYNDRNRQYSRVCRFCVTTRGLQGGQDVFSDSGIVTLDPLGVLEMCRRQGSVDVAKPPRAAPYLRSHYHILISPLQLKAAHVPRALNWILLLLLFLIPLFFLCRKIRLRSSQFTLLPEAGEFQRRTGSSGFPRVPVKHKQNGGFMVAASTGRTSVSK